MINYFYFVVFCLEKYLHVIPSCPSLGCLLIQQRYLISNKYESQNGQTWQKPTLDANSLDQKRVTYSRLLRTECSYALLNSWTLQNLSGQLGLMLNYLQSRKNILLSSSGISHLLWPLTLVLSVGISDFVTFFCIPPGICEQ